MPLNFTPFSEKVISRFWSFVDKSSDCWIWTASPNCKAGYGRITVDGKRYLAHHMAYLIDVGPVPEGMMLCHKCDNTQCVRPSHLFPGTSTDNNKDRARKGRSAVLRGEQNPFNKLTEGQVLEIRRLYQPRRMSQQKLAIMFNVSKACIEKITSRTNWKDLP